MQKLAIAVAGVCLSVGSAYAAKINQSTTFVAAEVVRKDAVGNATNVRAPQVTYFWDGSGPTAPANGIQTFEIVFTLGATGEWSYTNTAANPLVPNMARNAANTAKTISATVGGINGRRVPVAGPDVIPVAGNFVIRLREVRTGNSLVPANGGAPGDVKSVTYVFELVNQTNAPIGLNDLVLDFYSWKADPLGTPAGIYANNTNPADEALATIGTPEFASIYKLDPLTVVTSGFADDSAAAVCAPASELRTTIQATAGQGGVLGNIANNPPTPALETHNPNYLVIKPSLRLAVNAGPNRSISATNSFPNNLGANPTNGTGGIGGGRYTFRPTTPASLNPGFGAQANTVGAVAPGALDTITNPLPITGPQPRVYTASSGDEREALLGVVTFSNLDPRVLDRQVDSDPYIFAAPIPPVPPSLVDQSPTGTGRFGDFSTSNVAQVKGGVDVRGPQTGPALTWEFVAKSNGGYKSANGALRVVGLPALSSPVANICTGVAGPIVIPAETVLGNGLSRYTININHDDLAAAATAAAPGGATLSGKRIGLCLSVPGNETVPAATFTNSIARLFKDDGTEQGNQSCRVDLARIDGGVKIDVRNFAMSTAIGSNPNVLGLLRVINNSETETATVDAQYIYPNGAYGNWGTLVTLAPRAATYVSDTDVINRLTNRPALDATPRIEGRPTSTQLDRDVNNGGLVPAGGSGFSSIRLRVSADVPTLRVQNYIYDLGQRTLVEVSSAQGADFVNIESSNRDHIDQDAQTDIKR